MQTNAVVFLMGPTASGKTGLAVELARRLQADIVSVDSAMVYRGLDIGTAKPDAATLAAAPHRLIDIRDPAQAYSAADFCRDARAAIAAIHAAGRLPLLVGGTSLYFSALEHGLSPLPKADAGIRAAIEQQARQQGWAAMHRRLAVLDPPTGARIHPNDRQRIQRALEIHALTGQAPSMIYAARAKPALPWPLLKLALVPAARQVLHERINTRFQHMLAAGLYAEVEKLYARPDLNSRLPAIRAVGYRQLWRVIAGEWTMEQGVERAIIASRQLAKRQLTWLRRDDEVHWLDSGMDNLSQFVVKLIDSWYKAL
ncbi:MAG TPA: tRNA (adenosine(37)-N6)-dimethylallyltransferase MiaA [Salinisphaeraceae bacterium]|nr:tRNA (adenosine(37)-N6)-dimethylallyltransferase MiaA [Salinisphaeraceae bacterium]